MPLIFLSDDTGFFAGMIFKSSVVFATGDSRATGCRCDVIMSSLPFFTAARYPLRLFLKVATLTDSMAIFWPQWGHISIGISALNSAQRVQATVATTTGSRCTIGSFHRAL